MVTSLTAVADDLSGAAGLAGRWAGRAGAVAVAREAPLLRGGRLRVLDVETRLLGPREARRRVAQGWARLGAAGHRFQKLDSTLRGNPGAELEGFLSACAAPWVAVLPAYPELGRTVRDGVLRVHGRRLDRTEYARDPLAPAREWRVPRLLPSARPAHAPLSAVAAGEGALRSWLRRALRLRRPRLVGFDCAEPVHTRTIVRACLAEGCRHFAGAADLGRALARRLLGPARAARRPQGRWIVLAGSVSATTFAQLRAWGASGGLWRARVARDARGRWRPRRAPLRLPARGADACVALSSLERREDLDPWRRRRALRGVDAARCADEALGGLARWGLAAAGGPTGASWFATGGHTLAALCDAAGFRVLRVSGEVLPEVPLARTEGPGGAAWLCCKPGGFGPEDCFSRFMEA